jgi:hypothetical protein
LDQPRTIDANFHRISLYQKRVFSPLPFIKFICVETLPK